jgi:glycosyltransferase involved in cell wall biosynthesis
MGFWQTPLKKRVMNMLSRMNDRVLVNSESVRRLITGTEGVSAEKIDVIYNGIDTRPFNNGDWRIEARAKFGITHESSVVGLVSNLNREVKRVDLFLEAAGIVASQFPDVRFLIAGEGHLRPILEEKSKVIGLNGAMRFLGSERDIPSFLRALDVGVNCSDSEGMSNAVVEYMAAGIPAVVSAVPGNCEIVTDGVEGLHFPAGDALALAERIKLLLADPQRARQMGQRGREKARKQFSSEVMVHQHMQYYLKLLRSQE